MKQMRYHGTELSVTTIRGRGAFAGKRGGYKGGVRSNLYCLELEKLERALLVGLWGENPAKIREEGKGY